MQTINEVFVSDQSSQKNGELRALSKIIRTRIDNAAKSVVDKHKVSLLVESPSFIVPAVWGVKKDGRLDIVQELIYHEIEPVVTGVFDLLDINGINEKQQFAIIIMIRELLTTKIAHRVEILKVLLIHSMKENYEDKLSGWLQINDRMNTIGSA